MTNINDFKLGADPEFFVEKEGKPVSAYNLIPGTKSDPYFVNKGAIQVDGMALEFNIQPATNREAWNSNLKTVLTELRTRVPSEYQFKIEPVAQFGIDYIEQQPEEAKKLGCTPDFNAYTGEENPSPNADFPFRTASGHIHVGWTNGMDPLDEEHYDACRMMVKQLDTLLGMASLVWDKDTTRRELYGKAGAFRPKTYGVEYRVLSNSWLALPWARSMVFGVARRAFADLLKGIKYWEYFSQKEIQDVINTSNTKRAYEIAMGIGLPKTSEWSQSYHKWYVEQQHPDYIQDQFNKWVGFDAKLS